MVRLARIEDAPQLDELNILFNGEDESDMPHIIDSLARNDREIVVVDERDGLLVGFVCVQLKKSFCYNAPSSEIAEVFVRENYRRQGIARAMIGFAEDCCRQRGAVNGFTLLTEKTNAAAQALYRGLGYSEDNEMHMSK